MKKKKWAGIFTLLFGIVLLCGIGTRVILQNMDMDYQEVEVKVISGSQTRGRTYVDTDIIVNYKGDEYELIGATNTWEFFVGDKITAYLADGKLYDSPIAIKGDSALFVVSMIFMGASVVLLVPMLSFWVDYKKEKKSQAKSAATGK